MTFMGGVIIGIFIAFIISYLLFMWWMTKDGGIWR